MSIGLGHQSLETENFARSTKEGTITADIKLIGDRPAGQTDANRDILQIAMAAFQANGIPPAYECASTDSNMPMSLGIPALTIPRTGKADRFHALDEWIDTDPQSNLTVKKIVLTTVLGVVGAQ